MPVNNLGYVVTVWNGGTPTRLFRSGQPDALGFRTLYELGVRKIYKLNEGIEEIPADIQMSVEQHELPGLFRLEDKDAVKEICWRIQADLNQGINVLVHCTFGRDRTGLIIAAYRMIMQKLCYSLAEAERKEYGVNGIYSYLDIPDDLVLEQIAKENGVYNVEAKR